MYRVYGKPNCPYCVKAIDLLNENELAFEYYDLTKNAEMLQAIKDLGFKTVPQIWLNGDHIGGYTELQETL